MAHPIDKLSSKYPSQDTLTKVYGCNKYQLGDVMRNNFHIEDKFLLALNYYKVVHCSGNAFARECTDGQLLVSDPESIKRNGEDSKYNVIYHQCTPYAAKRAKEVRISFRSAQSDFQLEPIALVQIVDSGE